MVMDMVIEGDHNEGCRSQSQSPVLQLVQEGFCNENEIVNQGRHNNTSISSTISHDSIPTCVNTSLNNNNNKFPLTVVLPTSFFVPTQSSNDNNVTVMTLPTTVSNNNNPVHSHHPGGPSSCSYNIGTILLESQQQLNNNNLLEGGTISNRNFGMSNNNSIHNRIDDQLTNTLDNNPLETFNMNFVDNNSQNGNKNISCVTTTTTATQSPTTSATVPSSNNHHHHNNNNSNTNSSSLPPVPEFQQQQQSTVTISMDKTTTVIPSQHKNHIISFVGDDSKKSVGQEPASVIEACPVQDSEEVRWPAIVTLGSNNSPSSISISSNGATSFLSAESSQQNNNNRHNILDFNVIQSATTTTTTPNTVDLESSSSSSCSQQPNNNNNNTIIIEPSSSIDLLNFDSSIVVNSTNPSFSDTNTSTSHSSNSNTNNSDTSRIAQIQIPLTATVSKSCYSDDLSHLNPPTATKLNDQDAFLDFEMSCSSNDIAKVLEKFNAILDHEDNFNNNYPDYNDLDLNLNSPTSDFGFTNNLSENKINVHLPSTNDSDCLRLVDNFANLLIGENDDEDQILIIVDGDGDGAKSNAENRNQEEQPCSSSVHDNNNHTTKEISDEYDEEDLESEYQEPDTEDVEGYESDRPMMRASMRKLRPVPMASCSSDRENGVPHVRLFSQKENQHEHSVIQESPFPSPGHSTSVNESPTSSPSSVGLSVTTTLNSPVPNRILVTSLINSIMNNVAPLPLTSSSDSPTTSVLNPNEVVNNPIYGEINPLSTTGSENSSSNGGGTITTASASTISNGTTATTTSGTSVGSDNNSNNNNNGNSSSNSTGTGTSTSTSNSNSTDNTTLTDNNNGNNPTSTTTTTNTAGTRSAGRTSPLLAPGLRMPPGRWPHRLSSVLALIGCTLGLNNICRFSLLSVEYGANFILQFLFLSIIFGIPLFTFHMSIGQFLSSGIIDMWRISPIFQGIGIAVVISQAMIGIYTAVGISWIFHYFRDSFITRYDQYRWGKCFREYRGSACDAYLPFSNLTNFTESVPDYFHGVVLQRSSPDYPSSSSLPSSLKFTVAFNLAVVWMLVFVSLSKGLKSYGKVVHGFVIIPVASLLVLSSKMVGLVPADQAGALFGQTAWSNFFFNSQTWIVAAREAFFTWGLLGACVMQVTAHNRFTHSLKSDASIVVLITTFVLLLSAFLGNACYSVLLSHGYSYVPSSFESNKTYSFLVRTSNFPQLPQTPESSQTPSYMNQHISFLMGVRILKPQDSLDGNTFSGYTTLRLATELFPATMSLLGHTGLSPFWTVLFYFTFILFGIAQQLAIWHCVIRGVISIKKSILSCWEITITFCVCAFGFVLGLPLCTELGIFITYFMDYAIGSGWWIMVLYLLELVAVFIVRGAPYCGENIVTVLMTGSGKLAPLVSFTWNVILPVAMLVLSIASFKSGNIRELYDWNTGHGWPSWTKEIGSFLQLVPILAVPIVAIIKCCLYLTTGPPDIISERIQQLYRPTSRGLFGRALSAHLAANTNPTNDYPPGTNNGSESGDPPPKYTPPPSYSTATGAKIAKFLRNSFRRSMRRLAGGPSTSTDRDPPPPNYASVVLEINNSQQSNGNSTTQVPILLTPSTADSSGQGTENQANSKRYQIPLSQTLGRSLGESKERASLRRIASDITPRDIGRLLRASFRRGSSNNNNNQDNSNTSTTPTFRIESDFTTQQFENSQAQTQNNLNLSSESLLQQLQFPSSQNHHQTVTVTTSNPNPISRHQHQHQHHHRHLESDFLRVPQYHHSSTNNNSSSSNNNNTQLNVNVSVNVNNHNVPHHVYQNLYPRLPTYTHTRSSSSGSTFNHPSHRDNTSGSQLTLIHVGHSSSQNDLSHVDSMNDFRLGGIINPTFQFSQPQLQLQRHDCSSSLNQSEA